MAIPFWASDFEHQFVGALRNPAGSTHNYILGLHWDTGKQNGDYYLGFRA